MAKTKIKLADYEIKTDFKKTLSKIEGQKTKSIEAVGCKMPEKEITFGQFVKAKRLEKGYALRRFCEKLGIDQMIWSRIEMGRHPYCFGSITTRRIRELIIKEKDKKIFKKLLIKAKTIKINPKDLVADIAVFARETPFSLPQLNSAIQKKPPLGATPEYIFEAQRVQELSKAIHEFVDHYGFDIIDRQENISKWTTELTKRLQNLQKLKAEGKGKTMSDVMIKDSISFIGSGYRDKIID